MSDNTQEETDEMEDDQTKKQPTMDPELLVMRRIARLLEDLDPSSRLRVAIWVGDRYGRLGS